MTHFAVDEFTPGQRVWWKTGVNKRGRAILIEGVVIGILDGFVLVVVDKGEPRKYARSKVAPGLLSPRRGSDDLEGLDKVAEQMIAKHKRILAKQVQP